MSTRKATVILCDEILFSLTGKTNLLGCYTGDLSIPADPSPTVQLAFYFLIETDIADPFQSLTIQIALPGAEVIVQPIPTLPQMVPPGPGRTRATIRWPIVLPQPILRPGRIESKVIHEGGEMIAGMNWIVLANQPQPSN